MNSKQVPKMTKLPEKDMAKGKAKPKAEMVLIAETSIK